MNADLANALGNLLNRCTMPKILPEQCFPTSPLITKLLNKEANICKYDKEITELIDNVNKLYEQVDAAMEDIRTKNALLAIFSVVYQINALLQLSEPWKALKVDKDLHGLIMYVAMESLRIVGILLLPFLTTKAPIILKELGIPEDQWKINKEILTFGITEQGHKIGELKEILFMRYTPPKEEKPEPKKEQKKEPKQKKEKKEKKEKPQESEKPKE